MARNFDGVDDFITFGNLAPLTVFSMSAFYKLDAWTTTAGMRVVGKESSLNAVDNVDVSKGWQFFADWSGADGTWVTPASSIALGAWSNVVGTYNGGATTNDPKVYINGVSQTITEKTTPTGSYPADATLAFRIGNNATPGVRAWDGMIAEVGYWNRILTEKEAYMLSKGYSPLFFPRGLVVYVPLIGNHSPEKNYSNLKKTGTVTGATKANHPKIIYPRNFSR